MVASGKLEAEFWSRFSDRGRVPEWAGRNGRGAFKAGEAAERLLAPEIAALRTCDKVGLIPHAKHGGRGVWAFAEVGSKFEGTGFEKLHIVQTHVALVTAGGSGGAI